MNLLAEGRNEIASNYILQMMTCLQAYMGFSITV